MLSNLISKLQDQVTENAFTYSIVIIDNDARQTARDIVKNWQIKSMIPIDYNCVDEQNISLARNKAVENAKSNLIAFIDDDEFPVNVWLLNLYKTLLAYHADGTLGPVRPHYSDHTPTWLIKSKLCERRDVKTGTILHWDQTRTGNTLLRKTLFDNKNYWFDTAYGRTGGEDTMFFKRHHENGKVFIWCNEAPVYETVPPERCTKLFHIRKSLRIGCGVGENLRKYKAEFEHIGKQTNRCNSGCFCKRKALPLQSYLLSKSAFWIISMTFLLPFSVLTGQHLYMRCITKLSYNFGVISGFLGHVIIRYRN